MKVYKKDFDEIKPPIVASIGFFDGVHKGHLFLIEQLKKEAAERSLDTAIITFIEHPRQVLDDDFTFQMLCGSEEKMNHLAKANVDICIPLHFTVELSKKTAYEFMNEILKQQYNVDTLIIGYDHRFGHNRCEDFGQYVKYGKEIGINVVQAKELDTGEYVSSSQIRGHLNKGEIEEANQLLGYKYQLAGKVIEGLQIGRSIGFPTANIEIEGKNKLLPAHGVYASYAYIDGQQYNGMLYIGRRPSFQHDNYEVSVEINILDFDGDLYGQRLEIELLRYIRVDVRFSGVELLKRQLQEDDRRTRKYFEFI